jgi:hypothetical protein
MKPLVRVIGMTPLHLRNTICGFMRLPSSTDVFADA